MSTPVAETKPAEEQVPKGETKEETSTTASEEVQMKEVEKEATAKPSTAAEPSATAETATAAEPSTATEPSTTAEPSTATEASTTAETPTTAMEVDSTPTETKPEATTSAEATPKPEVKANGATSDAKAKTERALRLNGAARKRFRWLLDQGYTREEAAQLAKEPLKTKELRDRFNADTQSGGNADKADSKVDEELKNLSGAAKKRFKWLLKNGYTEKEALKMAREPMSAIGNKRNLSSNDGPPSKVLKTAPDAAGGVVMVVAARDYPTTSLTHAQTNEVKSAILKEVVQQKDSELKPRFESCVHVKGYLRVHCSDQETRQWLQRVVAKLTVPEGIKLKVASEKNLLKGDVYTGFFTDSRGDTNEAILEFVESQNDGINASKWKILTRKEIQNKQTIELMFTVDQASSKSIHNLGYELNYKFNKIKVRKQLKATEKAPVAANPNLRMARNMAPPQRERRTFNQPRPTSSSGSFVPIWDSNLPQKRAGNNFNQFDNPRSGNGWNNGINSFGLGGGGGGGSFGMNSGGNNSFGGSNSGGSGGRSNSFMGSNSRSNSFGGSNSRSNSFGGSNSRSNSNSNSFGMGGGRGGNQSNSNRPFDLVDSLYDQLKLIGSGGGNDGNNGNNSYGSTRRSGGNNSNGGGNNQWGRNTSSNSSFSGRSNNNGLGNRNFFTTTRSGFF